MMVSADQAAELYQLLHRSRVRCWVLGGWGVDALLGRQTREHHDLDVFLLADDLPALRRLFDARGFEIAYVWEENRWRDLGGETWPTAFVAEVTEGAELDVHVIDRDRSGSVVALWQAVWSWDEGSLDGRGHIAGTEVACVTAETQVAMHRGYELPETHRRDVELLQSLL